MGAIQLCHALDEIVNIFFVIKNPSNFPRITYYFKNKF